MFTGQLLIGWWFFLGTIAAYTMHLCVHICFISIWSYRQPSNSDFCFDLNIWKYIALSFCVLPNFHFNWFKTISIKFQLFLANWHYIASNTLHTHTRTHMIYPFVMHTLALMRANLLFCTNCTTRRCADRNQWSFDILFITSEFFCKHFNRSAPIVWPTGEKNMIAMINCVAFSKNGNQKFISFGNMENMENMIFSTLSAHACVRVIHALHRSLKRPHPLYVWALF